VRDLGDLEAVMKLHVRRGSRQSACPLLKDEDNEVWAMVFNQDGPTTAEARAQALAASVNFVSEHGEHLAALLEYIAEDPMAPQWERIAASSFGMDLLGALHAGGGVLGRAVPESRGDAAVRAERRG
jgi:hypothetical protein